MNIIKANPGWSLVEIVEEVGNEELFLFDVVAWGVISSGRDADVIPITAIGTQDVDGWALKSPCGHIIRPGGGWWKDQPEFVKCLKDEAGR